MCQLQITSYGCGHRRRTIFEPCSLTQMLNPSARNRTPSWCPNGLNTTQLNAVSTPCGRGYVDGSEYSCAELVLLQPLFSHEALVRTEFTDYNDRIEHIADCIELVSDSGRPELDYSLIPASEMQNMLTFQDEHHNSALPMYLAIARNTLRSAFDQLAVAHTHTVNVMLGCVPVECLPGLDMAIDINDLEPNNLGLSFYRQIYRPVRDTVRSAVDLLECTAVLACLDGVGWTLPDEDEQALSDGLVSLVRDRGVNPVQGGIRLEDYRVHLRERQMQVTQAEWCDPLDTAEMVVDPYFLG